MPSDRDESVKAQEAYWYWRNRAEKVEADLAAAREEIERLEIELTNAANGALVNRYVKEARKEAQDAKAKLDEARGLLEIAHNNLGPCKTWADDDPRTCINTGSMHCVSCAIVAFLAPPKPAE